jgi:hypothetical protein
MPRRLTVDGETFEVHRRRPGQYDLDCVSGPNAGYGFVSASSDGGPISDRWLVAQIKDFLAEIDPDTGYLTDLD